MKRFFYVTIFLTCLLVVIVNASALTKTNALVDQWVAIAKNTVREGAIVDISACYSFALHIDLALTGTAPEVTRGSLIKVLVSSSDSGDEDWTIYTVFPGEHGDMTANASAVLDGVEAVGSTVLEVGGTTPYQVFDGGKWAFIWDADSVAECEMVWLVSHVVGTSVTILDGTAYEHDSDDKIYGFADNYIIIIRDQFERVKVIYDNTATPSTVRTYTRCRISKVTEY